MALSSPMLSSALRDGLLREHELLDGLLAEVVRAMEPGNEAAVGNAWSAFETALTAQLDEEDRQLVSLLPNERNARILVHEHRYIRGRLTELRHALDAATLRISALKDLRDILRAHALNDDRLLYRWAEVELDARCRAAVLDGVAARIANHATPR